MNRPSGPEEAGDALSRLGVVVPSTDGWLAVRWTQSVCRGCAGCGGRCGLFAKPPGEVEVLEGLEAGVLAPGLTVEVCVPARGLRRGAAAGYGVGALAMLSGAALGHGLGSVLGRADVGALVGLVSGTFVAGWATKRSATTPRLAVRIASNHEPTGDA